MEEQRRKQEVDDVNMLLCFLRPATSQRAHPNDSIMIPLKEESEIFPASFYHTFEATLPRSNFQMLFCGPSNILLQSSCGLTRDNIRTCEGLAGATSGNVDDHPTSIETVNLNLCDTSYKQALACATAEMSFNAAFSNEATNFLRVNQCGILDQISQLEDYSKHSFPYSPNAPNIMHDMNLLGPPSSGFNEFSMVTNHQENMDFQGLSDHMNVHKSYILQPLAPVSTTKVLPILSAPGIKVPDVHYPQDCFPTAQYCLQQMHSEDLSQSCNYREEESLYLEDGNDTNGLRTWTNRQSYFDMHFPYGDEHLSQHFFQNHDEISKELTCSGSTFMGSISCPPHAEEFYGSEVIHPFLDEKIFYQLWPQLDPSAKGSDANQDLSWTEKYKFPEKHFTEKNRLTSVGTIKFNSFEKSDYKHSIAGGNMLSDDHMCLNGSLQVAQSCQQYSEIGWDHCAATSGRISNISSKPHKYDSVYDVTGKIYCMAKDQYGCRILQNKLTEGSAEDVEEIFNEISGHFAEVMAHPFGNYLVQKLLQLCNEDQMAQIINEVTARDGELVRISCDKHGTRVVQVIIKTIRSSEQTSRIVSSLKAGILELIKNANGYHVAKNCLEFLTSKHTEFIFDTAIAHCVELATNCYGCCVIKDSLDHSDGEKRCQLLSEIASNALILSQDPYGNYVVQHVLELEISWATSKVLEKFKGRYGYLSRQKFSSNVVEKCIEYAGEQLSSQIIQEFVDDFQLDQTLKDRFGNFVMQTALSYSKGPLHAALMEAIKPHIPALRASSYGKKILCSHGFMKQTMPSFPSSLVRRSS